MMRLKIGLTAVFAMALFAAPALARKPTPLPDPAAFTVGKSTLADVEAAAGTPNTDTVNADGTRVIGYLRARGHVKGASFIPIVGMFAGGATGTTDSVGFVFGADGLLKATTKTASRMDCGTFSGCK